MSVRGVTHTPAPATPCLNHVAAGGETALGMDFRLRVSNGAAISARCPGDYETQGRGHGSGEESLHGDHPLSARAASSYYTYFSSKGGVIVAALTDFGKQIKKRLIDLDKNQVWLIGQVREMTGLYFDNSYLYKIQTGQISTPSIVGAIRKILSI